MSLSLLNEEEERREGGRRRDGEKTGAASPGWSPPTRRMACSTDWIGLLVALLATVTA